MSHIELANQHTQIDVFRLMRDTMNVVMTIHIIIEIERCGVND